MGYIPSVEMWD